MKLLAAHDGEGLIHEVVFSPADAPTATVGTEIGLMVSEVELPKAFAGLNLSDPDRGRRQLDKLSEQLQELRVEVGKSNLIKPQKRRAK